MSSSQPDQNQKDAYHPSQPLDQGSAMGIPVRSINHLTVRWSSFPSVDVQNRTPAPWSTGLCNCFEDVGSCCLTLWCPCVTFGRIAEIVDRGSSSCGMSGALYTLIAIVTGCQCLYSCFYRSKMRGQYLLVENACGDCLVHCCCEACALCQEYRELQNRGFDMSIGWHSNVERQSHGVTTVPPAVTAAMIR